MLSKKPTLLTHEGLARLSKELEHLRTVGREEVAERLHQAFEDGQDDDFVDNAELEASRNAQAFLEGRIQELDEILNNYQIIDAVSYTHLRAHETVLDLVCRLLLEKKKHYHTKPLHSH